MRINVDLFELFCVKNATNGTYKFIGDSLRDNPDCLFTNLLDVNAKLITGGYAFAHVCFFNKFPSLRNIC